MEKIDISKIRGEWYEEAPMGTENSYPVYNEQGTGGVHWEIGHDDTIESIKLVAEKVNEVIDYLNLGKTGL